MRPILASAYAVVSSVAGAFAVAVPAMLGRRTWDPVTRAWARGIQRVAGVKVIGHGLEHAAGPGPFLVMTSHQSNLDVPSLVPFLPQNYNFVAKQSLRRVPFFGWGMEKGGCVFIDRGDRDKAIASLRAAGEAIRGGRSVVVFPEGTRSRDGRLQPFKKGPFHLALEARVPILPVVVTGTRDLLPIGGLTIRSGEVHVRFGAPIPVEEGMSLEALAATVHQAMEELLAQGADG